MEIDRIEISTRGPVGRGMRRQMNAAQKVVWAAGGREFAINNIPRRFTAEHAAEANYSPRAGQREPRGSKAFWKSYFGRKLRYKGTSDPFVWSGATRRNARIASVSATSKSAAVRLPSARKLNFHPRYAAEFRRVTVRERLEFAKSYDRNLDQELARQNESQTISITN